MDSDDEYERRSRGRDKFRRERSDYQERSGGRREDNRSGGGGGGNRRDDSWQDNRRGRQQQWDNNQRRNRDNYGGGGGRHHDGGGGPPMKRQRRDWDNSGYNNQGDFGGYNQANQWGTPVDAQQQSFINQQQPDTHSAPAMLSFKQFLNSQSDDIEAMEAVNKYQDYKLEFRKTQIADFFTKHKDEEWFRNKYHPRDALAYQSKLNDAVRKRAAVFIDLLQSGWFDRFTLTAEQGEEITKLLDAAVIKFEGGTDFDLQVLDEKKESEEGNKEDQSSTDGTQQTDSVLVQQETETPGDKGVIPTPVSPSSVPLPETPAPASASVKPAASKDEDVKPSSIPEPLTDQKSKDEGEQQSDKQDKSGEGKPRKRKRRNRDSYYYEGNNESESESDSEVESEPAPPGEESAKSDARERAAEESLHPPGVEPISSDEVMATDQEGAGGDKNVEEKAPSEVTENEAKQTETEEVGKSEKQEPSNDSTTTDVTSTDPARNETATTLVSGETKSEISEAKAEVPQPTNNENGEEKAESAMDTSAENTGKKADDEGEDENEDSGAEPEVTTPRALHLTVSLFVRSVPPKISHYDLDSLCARYPSYMRVVLSDPAPERKFSRRGWMTFKPNANIKDICWSLNNIKIKDVELNPMVNRELAKRVRTVSGAAVLKGWVENDITMAMKLILRLDEKFEVWKQLEKPEGETKKVEAKKQEETAGEGSSEGQKTDEKPDESVPTENEKKPSKKALKIEMPPSNPVLDSLPTNMSEKLTTISESDAKTGDQEMPEYETSEGSKVPGLETSEHPPPEIDDNLVKLLDRLLLYLRIVHSLDYYSGAEYLYEDDMPNRCGIIHIRSPLPDKVNYEEVTEWHKNLHQKLDQHLHKKESLKDDEAVQLGKKDQEQELEKFVQANTQELAKDKWLCPLSGKKFRGPEFVRKHIFNKHGDKVDEVKTEVSFFNNFVYDPTRPSEVTMKVVGPPNPVQQGFQGGMAQTSGIQNNTGGWGRGGGGMHYGNRGGYNNQYSGNFRSDHYSNRGSFPKQRRGSFSGGGPRHDSRPIIQYRDLDAPGDDSEFF